MLRRAALAALSASLLAVAPALVAPAFGANVAPTANPVPAFAATGGPKIVIVVGAVESTTSSFRSDADSIYAEAIKYTPNVVRVYSPNATWAAVSAAAQGASIFIYLGHGYGFPSPYKPILTPSVHDGMGLNEFPNQGDSDKKYYGESVVSGGIRLAKDAIVILNHLCYSAGSSESGDPEPTIPVAKQRVDNFASGFLRTGARAVMADSYTGNVISMIRAIFTTHQSIGAAWHTLWGGSTDITWSPLRNPAYTATMRPETPTSGFHRSIVGNLDLTTDQIVAGAGASTTAMATPDTTAPELWSVDGTTTLTPNFDGDDDSLNLVARYSEPVSWTATISDSTSAVLRTQSGSGDLPAISWLPIVGGVAVAEGDYSLTLKATDATGNAAPDATVPIHVTSLATPPTGVLGLVPAATVTNAATLSYGLTFAGPVTGLAANDFTITGSSSGCVVNAPIGAGASWTVTVSSCATGWVVLSLEPITVSDGTNLGPAGRITARSVILDRTAPTATAPKTGVRANVTLVGGTVQATLNWTAADSGSSGLGTYDLARSVDGGAFTTIKTGLTTTSYGVGLSSGHAYRFEVRAHDKAGNVSAWAAGVTLKPSVLQQTSTSLVWSGVWTTSTSTSYSGGSARYSSAAGASVSYAFSGRSIAAVFARGPARGAVKVWIDGVLVTTVDTYAATTSYGWVGFSRNFSSYGSHTLKLVVVGTATRPTIIFDALEVVR